MDIRDIHERLGDMWKEDINIYVLVKSDTSPLKYSIFDVETHYFVIIEDNIAAKYIIEKMLENNAKIYNTTEEMPPPIYAGRWSSLDEFIIYSKLAKKYNIKGKKDEKLQKNLGGKEYDYDEMEKEIISFLQNYRFKNQDNSSFHFC